MFKEGLTPVQSDAFQWLTQKYLPGTFAAGAGTSGLLGLVNLIRSNLAQPPKSPEPDVMNIPYRAPEPKKNRGLMGKFSADKRAMYNIPFLGHIPEFLGGDAQSGSEIPAMWPAVGLGGPAAFLAGSGAMKWLMNRHRQRLQGQEIEDARQEYEKSLLNQFKPFPSSKIKEVSSTDPMLSKAGSANLDEATIKCLIEKTASTDSKVSRLAERLDKLADKVAAQKQAWGPLDLISDAHKAQLMGAWSTIAPALMLTSGLGTYNYFKDQYDPVEAQREMLRRQREERESRRPSPIFARLTPVDEKSSPSQPLSSFGSPTSKQASDQDDINTKAAAFVKEFLGG